MFYILFSLTCAILAFVGFAVMRDATGKLVGLATAVLWVVTTLFNSIIVVETGQVAVARLFGTVQPTVYEHGLKFVNPLYDIERLNIRREIYQFSSSEGGGADSASTVAVTKDPVNLTIDVGFPIALNAELAHRVFERYGTNFQTKLIVPAARTAVRDATVRFTWREAAIEKRDELAKAMGEEFSRTLIQDLQQAGFSEAEAKNAFTVITPQVRKMQPPDRILLAMSEKEASQVDLDRQQILTDIAAKEAERRGNEGNGVKLLFQNLPKGFTTAEMSDVLLAISDKTRAEALMKAVELGQVQVIVMNGQNPAAGIPMPTAKSATAPGPQAAR